ncbi:hypothetical protein M3Y99_01132000 [Aphelenchoides fujianensis]|nr:hypothetical protein M3Y99_01132000 [Aphelenchoides fujianensis]
MLDRRAIFSVFFVFLILCVPGQAINEPTTTAMAAPREDNGYYIVEELQYVNSFRPCETKRRFCEVLCPTYCNRFDEEAQRYESCQCTGCYCRCSTIKNETMKRDAHGNLVCSRLVFEDGKVPIGGLLNGDDFFLKQVSKIAADTTTPSTPPNSPGKPFLSTAYQWLFSSQRFFARPQAPIIPIVQT